MAFENILEGLKASAVKASPLGKTLKLDFGSNKIVIDGTGAGNLVSTEDRETDCTVTIDEDTFTNVANGSLNPMMAFMSGKIKVKGDMSVATKMQSLFKA
ncbi:MAG TPA: SCP2 sterol-binding domain-containing protein [Chitinophagales bacterium]|nr:SCP2 sterol-binding domain-containing protein [Chitinophagales bacterium]